MGFGVKITLADSLFSEIVRERAGWICVRCKRQHEKKKNTMDTSHYWGRGSQSVRYDFENADALCRYPCHQGKDSSNPRQFGWEYQKQIKDHNGAESDGAYTAYKRKQLGENGFNLLMLRAHTPQKIDKKLLRLVFKKELAQMKDNRVVYKDYK